MASASDVHHWKSKVSAALQESQTLSSEHDACVRAAARAAAAASRAAAVAAKAIAKAAASQADFLESAAQRATLEEALAEASAIAAVLVAGEMPRSAPFPPLSVGEARTREGEAVTVAQGVAAALTREASDLREALTAAAQAQGRSTASTTASNIESIERARARELSSLALPQYASRMSTLSPLLDELMNKRDDLLKRTAATRAEIKSMNTETCLLETPSGFG